MDELPVARSLLLCDRAIIEERTKNISLIDCFNKWVVPALPSEAQQFTVFATLVNGRGTIPVDLRITRLVDETVIYEQQIPIVFPDPLIETKFIFRVRTLEFSSTGIYEVSILAREAPIAATRLNVVLAGDRS